MCCWTINFVIMMSKKQDGTSTDLINYKHQFSVFFQTQKTITILKLKDTFQIFKQINFSFLKLIPNEYYLDYRD